MRLKVISIAVCLLLPLAVAAQKKSGDYYTWVDDEGVTHISDSIPPDAAEKPKERINEHGVTLGHIEGRKTAEQIEAERVAQELQVQKELQRRADQALLSTYVSVQEIEMHRDRRIELFQAQARVTELYLRNLHRRLAQLKGEAGRYKPYSSDPDAPMVEPSLIQEIKEAEGSIERHEINLKTFRAEEKQIKDRFQGDIHRFMALKGLG